MVYIGPIIPDFGTTKPRVETPRRRQSNVQPNPTLDTPTRRTGATQRPRGGYVPNSPQSRQASASTFLESLYERKRFLDNRIEFLRVKIIEDTALGADTTASREERQRLIEERTTIKRDIASWENIKKEAAAEIVATPPSTSNSSVSSGTTTTTDSSQTVPPPADTTAAVNLSATKELYFTGNQRFLMETLDIKSNSPIYDPSLSPTATYQTVERLWKQGSATKGRIQTYTAFSDSSSAFGGRNLESFAASKSRTKKAFQFHYNPGSIDMSYGSVNDVDLGYLASGQAVTNFLQALGQVSFEILLNRMPDMKYIDPNTGTYRKDGVNYERDVYDRDPRTESSQTNELKDIYNKGTMYDLEFLLKILMGGTAYKSLLRGGELTSDLGFAVPQPVEAHLGNRLRYVISVTNLSVRHVIFNERMVPLFTTVSVNANRIPADTVSATNLNLGTGEILNNTSSSVVTGTPANPTIQ